MREDHGGLPGGLCSWGDIFVGRPFQERSTLVGLLAATSPGVTFVWSTFLRKVDLSKQVDHFGPLLTKAPGETVVEPNGGRPV